MSKLHSGSLGRQISPKFFFCLYDRAEDGKMIASNDRYKYYDAANVQLLILEDSPEEIKNIYIPRYNKNLGVEPMYCWKVFLIDSLGEKRIGYIEETKLKTLFSWN